MKKSKVLEAIKERRSIFQYKDEDVDMEVVDKILEGGRWAPSFANLQPWKFLVVRDAEKKRRLYEIAQRVTLFRQGIEEAPVVIAVATDKETDPNHYIEAGAVATQNMALVAQDLGLSSHWIGIFDVNSERRSAEKEARKVLGLSEDLRLISLLPVGKPDQTRTGERKELEEIVIRI